MTTVFIFPPTRPAAVSRGAHLTNGPGGMWARPGGRARQGGLPNSGTDDGCGRVTCPP